MSDVDRNLEKQAADFKVDVDRIAAIRQRAEANGYWRSGDDSAHALFRTDDVSFLLSALAAAEERAEHLSLALIENQNPGIDVTRVKAERLAAKWAREESADV